MRIGYEMVGRTLLAIIITNPTSASGIIIVLLKTSVKILRTLPDFIFVKTTYFQLVFNFEQTYTITIFREQGIMAHIP